jgi:hypothetical protein
MITAIGDSVMLGAAYDLVAAIPNIDVDASVGRQVSAAISLLQEREAAQQLGGTLLLHLGNNGTFTSAQFDQIMQIAGPDRRVFFINVHVPRSWQDSNNKVITDGVSRYPNAYLIDWAGATADAGSDIFISDGVHLQSAGAWLYTEVIEAALTGVPQVSDPQATPEPSVTSTATEPPSTTTPLPGSSATPSPPAATQMPGSMTPTATPATQGPSATPAPGFSGSLTTPGPSLTPTPVPSLIPTVTPSPTSTVTPTQVAPFS